MDCRYLLRFLSILSATVLFIGGPRITSAECLHSLSFIDMGTPPGDLTGDNLVSVTDVQCGILVSLWQLAGSLGTAPICLNGDPALADVQCDGGTNVADVIILITLALSAPLSPELDGDGDGCPDTCTPPQVRDGFATYTYGESAGGIYRLRPAPVTPQLPASSSGGGYILKARPFDHIANGVQ